MPFLCQGGNHECQWGRGCGKNIYFTLRSKGRFHFPDWIRPRLVLPQPCTPDRVDMMMLGRELQRFSQETPPFSMALSLLDYSHTQHFSTTIVLLTFLE